MEQSESYFDASRALDNFLHDSASATSKVLKSSKLATYCDKPTITVADRRDILLTLSALLCEEELTRLVAVHFEPILLELLWRAKYAQTKLVFFVTLGTLVGFYPSATQFWYHYTRNEPLFKLPLAETSIYGVSSPKAKRPRTTSNANHAGPSTETILSACLSFLWLNTSWFTESCDWSVLLDYANNDEPNIRWLAMQCVRLLSNTSEYEFNETIAKAFSKEEIVNFRLHYSHLFASRIYSPQSPSLDRESPLSDQQPKPVAHYGASKINFKKSDFSSMVVSVCDVLLNKITEGPVEKNRSTLQHIIVLVPSFEKCLRRLALSTSVNEPVVVEGGVGSGKSALIEFLAASVSAKLIRVQLGDQIDSKLLIGTHCCTEIPGDFVWRAGPLTQAMLNGNWLLMEDIDCASPDVITILTAAIKTRSLSSLPGASTTGAAHADFRIFFTRRLVGSHTEFVNRTVQNELDKICTKISLQQLTRSEQETVIGSNWPTLKPILPRILDVYGALTDNSDIFDRDSSSGGNSRIVSVRDLIKWCQRLAVYFKVNSTEAANFAFLDAADCFFQSFADIRSRLVRAEALGVHLNVSKNEAEHLIAQRRPEVNVTVNKFAVGRSSLVRHHQNGSSFSRQEPNKSCFAFTQQSLALLERICTAVAANEPVLLVGETGTGKTSTIQYIASVLGHRLTVVNMNQQSDSCDLLGGYKPVEFAVIAQPLRREFEELFSTTFSLEENAKFLSHVNLCYQNKRWDDLFTLMLHVKSRALDKTDCQCLDKWNELGSRISELRTKCKLDEKRYLVSFAYIEGSLVKAMSEGNWILLDEINLAEAETLQCLSSVLDSDSGSVVLLDKADGKAVDRHPNFRLFSCMNPATDVGKKELTLGIRNRFTELYVDELESETDLQILVSSYLQRLGVPTSQISKIVKFYLKAKEQSKSALSDTTGHKPHYSLRTLCRALSVTATNPCGIVARSLYESFCLSFLTQLDLKSRTVVETLITNMLLGDQNSTSIKGLEIPEPQKVKCTKYEGYWIPLGSKEPVLNSSYILTPSVRKNLKDLARIISIGKTFPILLQGETSVGKTSLIQWLADSTGNVCMRVNNHEHTDLQEYVGSYCSDSSGKLVFKEGILVEAMRHGYWIILDELNLAPTEVLEALNRVLDDNRELFITETQKTVKAHPRFLLFATQNPPGHYGGRKMLSRAFRNRFVELHFDEIPHSELETILHQRCSLPMSYAKKMVGVLIELQLRRRESGVFAGKQGFITLRDLFRWGERYRIFSATVKDTFFDWETQVALQGYMLLAGRVRKAEEAELVKEVLEKKFKRQLDVGAYFEKMHSELMLVSNLKCGLSDDFKHLVWTRELKRLAVVLWESLKYNEPVLLVGETGCGKTTVCQLYSALHGLKLFAVNCHMHSEGSDFLGSLRPVRDKTNNDDKLFEWVDGPLVDAMKEGGVFLADEISLADDSVLERLNSVLEPERSLLLAEKSLDDGSADCAVIKAVDNFRLVATMNPGGDYGKKELSPALRNRFTEIWCPVTSDLGDLGAIIEHNVDTQLSSDSEKISKVICDFFAWFRDEVSMKKNVSSVRDILAWVQFVNKVTSNSVTRKLTVSEALVNGAQLVFIDAVGCGGFLGSDEAGKAKRIAQRCIEHLENIVAAVFSRTSHERSDDEKIIEDVNEQETFGIDPFFIELSRKENVQKVDYTFEAKGVTVNSRKVLRAMQLPRPILLEGVPGVGKTSLVQALAKSTGHDLIRINLSEQTDISDLFGGDLPVEDENDGSGSFAWRDGPLLQALKSDNCWVVLDELNLASQSVLEGLNACLDHRGEIFVAELAKSFKVNKENTRIFACQNPYGQGGARKGLPKSFLNRFTVCYIDAFTTDDLEFVVGQMYPALPSELVTKMIEVNQLVLKAIAAGNLGRRGAPWELNLRDIFRWCDLICDYYKGSKTSIDCTMFAKVIYADRFRTKEDKLRVDNIFQLMFGACSSSSDAVKLQVFPSTIEVGHQTMSRRAPAMDDKNFQVLYSQLPALESLMTCVNMNWLAILIGPSGVGKSSLVSQLAQLAGRPLSSLTVSSEMDTIELLGGFEKKDLVRHFVLLEDAVLKELKEQIRSLAGKLLVTRSQELSKLWRDYRQRTRENSKEVDEVKRFLFNLKNLLKVAVDLQRDTVRQLQLKTRIEKLIEKVSKSKSLSGGNFEWIDSQLVTAIKNGHWLLIDDVNLCSSSVLDRLNGLLEPKGTLIMTEQGVVENEIPVITPHEDFRLIMTMDPRNGELSRAMRNRGIEICMLPIDDARDLDRLLSLHGLADGQIRSILVQFHMRLSQQPEFVSCNLNSSHLLQATRLLLNDIRSDCDRLSRAIGEVYGKMAYSDTAAKMVEDVLADVSGSESLSAVSQDCRRSLGDSLVSRASDDLAALGEAQRLVNGKVDDSQLLAASAMRIYFERQSEEDSALRKRLAEEAKRQMNDLEVTEVKRTLEALTSILRRETVEPVKMSEQPVDFRFNRTLWDKFWTQHSDIDKRSRVERCLNQYILDQYWKTLKCLFGSNSEDSVLDFSEKFNKKQLAANQLPAVFVRHVKELVDVVENQLVKSALQLVPSDEDYFLLQEMLAWIFDLFSFFYGQKCSRTNGPELVDKFVVLWTLTNQFSINKLRSHFEVDISKLIDKVNESVKIDIIEHRKGWNKVVSSMSSNIKFCADKQSADALQKILELTSLWNVLPEKMLYKDVRAKLFALLVKLTRSDELSEHADNLRGELENIEGQIRTVLTPKNEEEEENDVDLLTKIKRRKLLSSCEILPLWQLLFNLSEKKLIGNFESDGSLSCQLMDDIAPFTSPFYELYVTRSEQVTCERILFYFLDTFHNLTAHSVLSYMTKKTTIDSAEDKKMNIWHEEGILLESCPSFTVVATNYLSNESVNLGVVAQKKKDGASFHLFLWNNYSKLSQPRSVDLLHYHRQMVTEWLATVRKHANVLGDLGERALKVFDEASEILSSAHISNERLGLAEVLVGLASCNLVAPVNTIDPVQRRTCKLSHFESRLRQIDADLLLRDALSVIETGQGLDVHSEHPHVACYAETRTLLERKIEKLSKMKCYRPIPSQYLKLRNDVKRFLATQLNISEIKKLVMRAMTRNLSTFECNKTLQNVLRIETSLTNFISHLMSSYVLYGDIVNCFLASLAFVKHGLQILAHELRVKMIRENEPELLLKTVTDFCHDSLSLFKPDFEQQSTDENLQKVLLQALGRTKDTKRNSMVVLRCALIDMQRSLGLNQRRQNEIKTAAENILNQFICSWKVSEDEKEAKRAAEEQQFEFKVRHHEGELSEEERDALRLAEQFPSFEKDYRDIVDVHSMELDDDDDAECSGKVSSSDDAQLLRLDDDEALEVIALHEEIVKALNAENLASNGPRDASWLTDTARLRYEVASQLIEAYGPALTSHFSENDMISAHILQSHRLGMSTGRTKTSFNIYRDHAVDELYACHAILERVENRIVGDLLVQFPGHPTLTKLLRIISRIFEFPIHSPLIRFVTGLELILETAQEWQQIAHRGIKLTDELAEMTLLVINWRKMELKHWSCCMDSVTEKIEAEEKSKWWFHFYYLLTQLFIAGEDSDNGPKRKENIMSFVVAIKKFMESATIGNYSVRHGLLNSFSLHVRATKGTTSDLYCALNNVHSFYGQFSEKIGDKVKAERSLLDKQLKEFVKVMRWNDINFWSVKTAVERSHKTLLKFMKKAELALNMPVGPLLVVNAGELERAVEVWTLAIDQRRFLVEKSFVIPDAALSDPVISGAKNFSKKMRSLSKQIMASNLALEQSVGDVNEMVTDIIDQMRTLQSLHVPADVKEKTVWKKKAHHIHNRKRKALADLFKKLNESGLSFRKGLVIAADFSNDEVLLKTGPVLPRPGAVENDQFSQDIHSTNSYFCSILARNSALLEALNAPSKELSVANIDRVKGYSGHFVSVIMKQRQELSRQLEATFAFNKTVQLLTTGNSSRPVAQQANAKQWLERTYALAERTLTTLLKTKEFLACKPQSIGQEIYQMTESLCPPESCQRLIEIVEVFAPKLREQLSSGQLVRPLLTEHDVSKCAAVFDTLTSFTENFGQIEEQSNPMYTALSDVSGEIVESHSAFLACEHFSSKTKATDFEAKQTSSLITHTMVSIETLFKHCKELDEKVYNVREISEFDVVWKAFNFSKMDLLLDSFTTSACQLCEQGLTTDVMNLLKIIEPFVGQFLKLSEYFVTLATASLRANSKLLHVLLGIFTELTTKGFCLPQEPENGQDQKTGEQFKEISDGGLGEGDGAKDVSEKIESEDQLEDTLKDGAEQEKRDEQDKNLKGEDNAVEMSDDFDGKSYDPEEGEEEDEKDDDQENDDKEQLDDQMGDLDKEDETYDKKVWDDDNEEDDESEMSDIENDGRGEDIGEEKMVANEENRGLNSKEDKEEKERSDDPSDDKDDEINEKEQNDEYDGEREDPLKSKGKENRPEDKEVPPEFPENMELDAEEGDEGAEDEELPPEPESEQVDGQDGDGFKEVEQNENDDQKESEGGPESKEKNDDENEEQEGSDADKVDVEGDSEKPEEDLDKEDGLTEDTNETEDAAAIPSTDSKLQKDNVQSVPENTKKEQKSSDMTSNEHEEDHGVGEAQVGQNSEGHEGVAEAQVATEEVFGREQQNFKPNLKQKDRRSVAKEDKKSAKRQKVLDKEDDGASEEQNLEKREKGKKSSLFQHIDEDEVSDDEVMDTAAEDDAKDSRPNREDEVADKLEDDDEVKPEEMDADRNDHKDDLGKSLESMKIKTDGKKDEKNKKLSAKKAEDDLDSGGDIDVEGDFMVTEGVARAPDSSYHTQTETASSNLVDRDWIRRLAPVERGYMSGKVPLDQATKAWDECSTVVAPLVYELCEQLQLVLEPTKSAKLKGDYRSGKRINMRKVVAYIASQFRKDKIWMKRNKPSKRTYQILLAVDDSLSMADNQSKKLAFESLALLSKSLSLLEAGELGVMSFGEEVKLLHQLGEPFTDAAGAHLLTDFTFEQKQTRIAALLEAVSSLMFSSRNNSSKSTKDISQLLLIISDGRGVFNEGEQLVRQFIRRLRDCGIFIVFLVLDNPKNKDSILDIRNANFENGAVKIESYMEKFPFPYYIILKNINQMPVVLGEALRQWFELVTASDR